jgi:hypothetical protein
LRDLAIGLSTVAFDKPSKSAKKMLHSPSKFIHLFVATPSLDSPIAVLQKFIFNLKAIANVVSYRNTTELCISGLEVSCLQ